MPHKLSGTASDELPQVLATGVTDVELIFASLSAREPSGRDADYLEWHSLDHRPEQYRIAGLRHSIRLVSTPACRAARAFGDSRYDPVDHVMTYFFAAGAALGEFSALSAALSGDRRPLRLPSVDGNYFRLAGKVAARTAMVGADVIPWRPARGVYLLIEQGLSSPVSLVDVAGVAGIWWHDGGKSPVPGFSDTGGVRLSYCFLEDEPVATAQRLRPTLKRRWEAGAAVPLLAAPFHILVPFEWARYLP